MDVRGDEELRVLRERAYGPDADIHLDPVALARLRELESVVTATDAAPSAPPALTPMRDDPSTARREEPLDGQPFDADPLDADPFDADAFDADPAPPAPGSAEGTPPAASTDPRDDAPARRGTLSRRTIWLWAASVALALVAGAGITMTTSSSGGNQVAVLPEVEVTEWPTSVFGDPQEGARVFEVFEGTRALVVPNAWGGPGSEIVCLFVVPAEGPDGAPAVNEILTTGCGGTAFAPSASLDVDEGSPEALRDRFPDGTGVRFAIEGDEVHVYTRTP
ncbi:hypothetical protein [Microbacterium sp. SSM24]|uniref:hypothetical protein n=1 Tax=Microbacterium sp. SSM24 TaxID=2991714 RepID=UPI0022278266|nr:hypothetical protein [Microbacterium sp. SSM24]MCW3493048.1 hypothetical protein [Microbacterium sp. SSM24]